MSAINFQSTRKFKVIKWNKCWRNRYEIELLSIFRVHTFNAILRIFCCGKLVPMVVRSFSRPFTHIPHVFVRDCKINSASMKSDQCCVSNFTIINDSKTIAPTHFILNCEKTKLVHCKCSLSIFPYELNDLAEHSMRAVFCTRTAHTAQTPLCWCIRAFDAIVHCGFSVRVFVLSIVDTREAHLWPNMRFYLFSISHLFLFVTARCRKALTKSYFNQIYANIVWNDCGVGDVQFSAHNNLWSGYCSLVTYHAVCAFWNGYCLLYEYVRLTQSEPTG